MKILSLFDGISCARVALERAGIQVEKYYASEIDKYAIQISNKNYPDIKQIGDVNYISSEEGLSMYLPEIDLMIGGSPCQDLSIAKKNRKGLDGERSGLFWKYVEILKYVKPKYFILENVASMSKESKDLITKEIGVEPIMIDASLVSAQSRKRLFWTNIPNVTQPNDRNILLKDIIDTTKSRRKIEIKYPIIKTSTGVKWDTGKGHFSQQSRARNLNSKMNCIPNGQGIGKTKIYFSDSIWELLPEEAEILQGLPVGYTESLPKTIRIDLIGNAFNVDVIAHILSFIK